MLVLGLITCIVLRALSAQAKVVHRFEECKEFLYQGIEPRGMDPNAKKICQKLQNSSFYYATLYSVHHKIPLYSAYTLDPDCSSDTERKDIWHLEPQISESTAKTDHMVRENKTIKNLYQGNQAISNDYSRTRYDRGHLNPSSFQCGDGRTATFTLTNAAPMKERFNRNHWRNWESMLRGYLIGKLFMDDYSATAFIVTGTVPDPKVRIPQDRKRVTVPPHIWAAVCYKHHIDDSKSLSFGCIGRNQQEQPDIRPMSVSDLNNELTSHFRTNQPIKIFADDCFSDNNKLVEVQGVFWKSNNLIVNQAKSPEIQNKDHTEKRTISCDSTPEKQFKLNENTGKIAFDSMSSYYTLADFLEFFARSACLITYTKTLGRKPVNVDLRKREVSTGPDAVECQLVPEKQKTAADGSRCSNITESDYSCQCYTGGETKPCCSSPCLYQDDLKGYRCYSDQAPLIECSPPYSLITVNGKRCLDDYPCATYGKDYYWCKTTNSWDYCSPPLRNSKTINGQCCRSNHACAKYGYEYTWCYTDDEDNWDYC